MILLSYYLIITIVVGQKLRGCLQSPFLLFWCLGRGSRARWPLRFAFFREIESESHIYVTARQTRLLHKDLDDGQFAA